MKRNLKYTLIVAEKIKGNPSYCWKSETRFIGDPCQTLTKMFDYSVSNEILSRLKNEENFYWQKNHSDMTQCQNVLHI